MIKVDIVNVVATATLAQEIDLRELGKLKEIFYDPEVYGGRVAYFKSPTMKGKVSIFATGKMVSMGTKSEEEAVRELKYVKSFLVQKSLVKPTELDHKIRNIVVMADYRKRIDIEELARKHKVIYEPDQWPGAILKIGKFHQTTVLLFASGKAVVTGLKSFSHIGPVLEEIESMMKGSSV